MLGDLVVEITLEVQAVVLGSLFGVVPGRVWKGVSIIQVNLFPPGSRFIVHICVLDSRIHVHSRLWRMPLLLTTSTTR